MDAPTAAAAPRAFNVTLKSVFAIALPMTLAHASTPLIGITDMAVIGQLGSAALIGAVALGAILFDFIGGTLNFLRLGTTGLVAQAMGAGDRAAEATALWRAMVLAAILGVLIMVLQTPLIALFVRAMAPSEEVANAVRAYWDVRVYAAPFMLMNYAILGWLLGLGRAGLGLVLQVLLSMSNIALSLLFVLWLDFGVMGVAAASVLAEAIALMAALVVVWRHFRHGPAPRFAEVFERSGFLRTLAVNRDILIRSLLLLTAFAMFTAASARFGDVTLAANAILMNAFLLSAHILDGLATAAEQLGGRAVGARNREGFRKTVRLTVVAGTVISLGVGAFWIAAGEPLIALMTTAQDVRAESMTYLWWAALAPVAGALAFVMDGLYIGATWTRMMRNMMLGSTLIFVAAWWLLTPQFANHGLWAALNLWLLLRGLSLSALVPHEIRKTFPE